MWTFCKLSVIAGGNILVITNNASQANKTNNKTTIFTQNEEKSRWLHPIVFWRKSSKIESRRPERSEHTVKITIMMRFLYLRRFLYARWTIDSVTSLDVITILSLAKFLFDIPNFLLCCYSNKHYIIILKLSVKNMPPVENFIDKSIASASHIPFAFWLKLTLKGKHFPSTRKS